MKIEIEQEEYDKLKDKISCLEGDCLIYKMKIEALTDRYKLFREIQSDFVEKKCISFIETSKKMYEKSN